MNNNTLLLAGLLASGNVFAQMEVSILGEQYEVDLFTTIGHYYVTGPISAEVIPDPRSQSLSSEAPISDALRPTATTFAQASASTFSVNTETSALPRVDDRGFYETDVRAVATAQTVVTFSPVADGTAPLAFDFAGSSFSQFSDGFISLQDLTTTESLFKYSWVLRNGGSGSIVPAGDLVPWICCYAAQLNLSPQLFGAHDYALTLHASTEGSNDGQRVAISMAGLSIASPAPEPETWAMMLLGLVGIAISRRSSPSRRF